MSQNSIQAGETLKKDSPRGCEIPAQPNTFALILLILLAIIQAFYRHYGQSIKITFQHATEKVSSGDTVYVRQGTYNESVQFNRSGYLNNYIIFQAYPGETPGIEGHEVGIGTAVRIYGSYIKLIGLEIRNCETGIEMTGHHIKIADCQVHELMFGKSPHNGYHDFILNRVNIYNFFLCGFDASRWESSEPVCYGGAFNDCLAHDCLDPNQNVDGFAFGDGHNFVFNHCSVFNVYNGFDIKADNTTLNRCAASQCFNGGYKLWADNTKLINCLGFNHGTNHGELDWDGISGTSTLQNCASAGSETYSIWVENSQDHSQ